MSHPHVSGHIAVETSVPPSHTSIGNARSGRPTTRAGLHQSSGIRAIPGRPMEGRVLCTHT